MNKESKKKIKEFFNIIVDEAEKNDEFAKSLYNIFENNEEKIKPAISKEPKRSPKRRDKAVLDPIKLSEDNKLTKDILAELTEKELKDIIADYGMDSTKLAMKLKDKDRLIQLILESASRRATKGNAFRSGSKI